MGGSHAAWANGLAAHSRYKIEILGLPARHWKWRMHGGAVTLAEKFLELQKVPDLILATDMLDLSTFLGLTRSRSQGIPVGLYFHENQLTYPWSPADADVKLKRDNHYGFVNYTSALVADRVFFNSSYHLESFLGALPAFLRSFPDKRNFSTIDQIRAKSSVLHLGMDLSGNEPIDQAAKSETAPKLLLWNHRWEYDKGPEEFFQTLIELKEEGIPFELAVLGQSYSKVPAIFETARAALSDRILQWGYSEDGYLHWLQKADCLPVTSRQDFFGGSVVEAMYHNCWPLLPDRLAYPEHIPKAHQSEVLYPEGGFKHALKRYLTSPFPPHQPQKWVEQYDWKKSADQYDLAFGNMASMR